VSSADRRDIPPHRRRLLAAIHFVLDEGTDGRRVRWQIRLPAPFAKCLEDRAVGLLVA
jgi:hypothetical protein